MVASNRIAESPFKRTDSRTRTDLLICLCAVFCDFLGDNLLIPSYAAFLAENSPSGIGFGTAASLATMTYIIGKAICPLYFGFLSDFLGRRTCLLMSSFLTALGFFLQALAPGYWYLVAFRLLTGLVGGTRTVAVVYISDWLRTPELLTFWMSWVPTTQSLASTLGPLFGGVVVQVSPESPLNAAFVGFALNALCFIVMALFLRSTPYDRDFAVWGRLQRGHRESDVDKYLHVLSTPHVPRNHNIMKLRKPGPRVQWLAIVPLLIAFGISNGASQAWLVVLVTVQLSLGISALAVGLLGAWCGAWIIFGQVVVLPIWLNYLKRSTLSLMVFGFSISSGVILLAFVLNIWTVAAAGAILSMGLALAKTGTFSLFPRLCDISVKGRLFGVFSMASNGSKAAFMSATGALYDFSRSADFIALTACIVLGALVSIAFIWAFPKEARRQKCLNVESEAAKKGYEICEAEPMWKKRQLTSRFGLFQYKQSHLMLLRPFGRVTAGELTAVSSMLSSSYGALPRLSSRSKSVLIPPLMEFFLGEWTSRMLEHHGYSNWKDSFEDIKTILDVGLPDIPMGLTRTSDERLARLHAIVCRHMTIQNGSKQLNRDEEWAKHEISSSLRGSIQRLCARASYSATDRARLLFGRRLSALLIDKGYAEWPDLFSNSNALHVILRSSFPPSRGSAKPTLRYLVNLSKCSYLAMH